MQENQERKEQERSKQGRMSEGSREEEEDGRTGGRVDGRTVGGGQRTLHRRLVPFPVSPPPEGRHQRAPQAG